MAITLEDLQKKIEDMEKELEELKAAHRVMKRFDGKALNSTEQNLSSTQAETTSSLSETGIINLDELDLPIKVAKTSSSLHANVKNLIMRFGSQEFTVNHVHAALNKTGKGSDAKHFKNRVSVTIRKLTDEGMLERTHKGKGSEAHKYQLAARKVSLVKNSGDED